MSESQRPPHTPERVGANDGSTVGAEHQGSEPLEANQEGVHPIIAAYYGLREVLSRYRMERAGDRMAKMDHKMSFYSELQHEAESYKPEKDGGVYASPEEEAGGSREAQRNPDGTYTSRTGKSEPSLSWIEERAGIRAQERKRVKKVYKGTRTKPKKIGQPIIEHEQRQLWIEDANRRLDQERPDLAILVNDSSAARTEKVNERQAIIRHYRRNQSDTLSTNSSEAPAKRKKNTMQKIHSPLFGVAEYRHLTNWSKIRRDRAIGSIIKHHSKSEYFQKKRLR